MELPGGGKHLCAGVDEFEQVGPGLVDLVLPLGDGGGVAVARADELVANVVDASDALLSDRLSFARELFESVAQHLCIKMKTLHDD